MTRQSTGNRAALIWLLSIVAALVPVVAAAFSPQLEWRSPVYILAGFAGIIAMVLMVFQPLLAGGYLPGLPPRPGRHVHKFIGVFLVFAVVIHVLGLWITSPPDVVDALLFRSPTSFSIWGVIAMWSVFVAACLAVLRGYLSVNIWRRGHTALVTIAVIGTVVHVLLIEGTMEPLSKVALCGVALLALAKTIYALRAWMLRPRAAKKAP